MCIRDRYAHYWADLTDKNESYGVSILNDSKYGWDKPNDNTIRLTLLHTPETKRNYAYQNRQDFGFHSFTYSLIGHDGKLDKAETCLLYTSIGVVSYSFRDISASCWLGDSSGKVTINAVSYTHLDSVHW